MEIIIEFIKDIESKIEFVAEESKDEFRNKIINISTDYFKKSNKISQFDRDISKKLNETKQFFRDNKHIFVTHADKGSVTVILKKDDYETKVYNLLNYITSYTRLNYNPENELKKSNKQNSRKLEMWLFR